MNIVILAGGRGSRLRPLSQDSFPKQFLKFGARHSLLQKTLLRFLNVAPAEKILIVTNEECLALVEQQSQEIDPRFKDQILLEPERKNTGPAIVFALRHLIEKRGVSENEIALIAPSDHYFFSEEPLLSTFAAATAEAREGHIVLFGAAPHKPETGYGYIKVKKESSPFHVEAFVEKPDFETARAYLLSGDYFWNTGIFLSQISLLFNELRLHAPALFANNFSDLPNISIDYALMEKTKKCLLMQLGGGWSDVGTWDNLYEAFEKDHNHHVKIGAALDIKTKSASHIDGKKVIATVGHLQDLIIFEQDDELFLSRKS